MPFLLITVGSHGDVHPFIGLAKVLRSRGHAVRIATNPTFAPLIQKNGIEFTPVGTAEQFNTWTDNPDVWHPRKGGLAVLRGTSETLQLTYNLAREFTIETGGTVVASTLSMGALCARETHRAKVVTVHLAPICIRSHYELPRLPIPFDLNRMPMFMRKNFWRGADRFSIDPAIAPSVNELRKSLGLARVKSILGSWMNSPDLTLGLWPEWFSRAQPDWPQNARLAGFPMYDEGDVTPLPAELLAFLDANEAPIAFTPGSAMKFANKFFQTAADACALLKRPGLLLTRHVDQIPQSLPPGVIHVPYAPFGKLLPRCAAIVHHGGIGTTSQALKSACPQLIMPMAHDQPDNAHRVQQLGCGSFVWPRSFTPRRVASELSKILSQETKQNAIKIATRFTCETPLLRACELIEAV